MAGKKSRHPTAIWIARRKTAGGTTYRLRWRDRSGRWHSRACGRDYALARELRNQKRAELRAGAAGELPDVSLEQLADRLPLLMAGKARKTIASTQDSVRLLDELCRPGVLGEVDRGAVARFRAARLASGLSPATVNHQLRELKSALSYAVDAGLLKANPLLRWKGMMIREPERTVRVVEPAEFEKLLTACELPEMRAAIIVAYRQGLRRTELSNLRWLGPNGEMLVDLEGGVVHIINRRDEGELTKSRKNRTLPLHPQVRDTLTKMWEAAPKVVADGRQQPKYPHVFTLPEGRRMDPTWLTHEFKRIMEASGLPRCTLHDLRRSFSTLAQRAGVDRCVVRDLGGWSTVSVVERHYTGNLSGVMREAMAKIIAAG